MTLAFKDAAWHYRNESETQARHFLRNRNMHKIVRVNEFLISTKNKQTNKKTTLHFGLGWRKTVSLFMAQPLPKSTMGLTGRIFSFFIFRPGSLLL